MAKITFQGNPVITSGRLPDPGTPAPDFVLTKTDLSDTYLKDYTGKIVVLNIFPSIDTPVCSRSVQEFNKNIDNHENAVMLCVSADLPFAHERFCSQEGIEHVILTSDFRNRDFGPTYGVRITSGPLEGLLARAVVVIDTAGKVVYTQLVDEITDEPDYKSAFNCIQSQEKLDSCTATFTAEHSRGFDDDGPCDDGRSGP